jgi:nucleoside 2-deoxyribosyltransferase
MSKQLRPAQKVYLAGPMRGIPEFNFPEFFRATAKLRDAGFEVWSPAEHDQEVGVKGSNYATGDEDKLALDTGITIRQLLGADTKWICAGADAVVLLLGWQSSKGATAERALALALGIDVYYLDKNYELHALPIDEHSQPLVEPGSHFPSDSKARKEYPVYTGVLEYFPDAIAAVAHVSFVGNQQHNPGQPLHWSRGKSDDHHDTCLRHLLDRSGRDVDGQLHSAKAAWRALAICQLEIEASRGAKVNPA